MKSNKSVFKETLILVLGELIVSLGIVGGYFILGPFKDVTTISIILGAALGSVVMILNYFFLHLFVNRLIDNFLAIRGTREMTPEELLQFTTEQSIRIKNAIKISFIVRLATMVGALVSAFVFTSYVNVIATVIPIVAYRPILTVGETLRRKLNPQPAPDPNNFITYDSEADGYEEINDDEEPDLSATAEISDGESNAASEEGGETAKAPTADAASDISNENNETKESDE